jgi:molecular chaperone GrpE
MTDKTDGRDQGLERAGREDQLEPEAEDAGTGDGRDEQQAGDVAAELEDLRGELGRVNDRHLRLAAEFDNYRKRTERDRQALSARLQADLVSELLEVVDDLERVAATGESTTAEGVVEGVVLVKKKFLNILSAAGLEAIDAEGEPFDPLTMEAVAVAPTGDPDEDHVVADVFQRGYRFGEVLVRPARVRVMSYEGSAGGSE